MSLNSKNRADAQTRVRDRRKKGWFHMDNIVLDDHGKSLGAYAIATYAVLCRHASNDYRSCQIGINTIASKIGASRNAVKRALRILEDAHLVQIELQFDGDRQFASEYILLDATIPQGGSADDRGPEMTGVTSGPGVGPEVTGGGSPEGHLYKDQLKKDLKIKTVSLRDLNDAMVLVRSSSQPPSELVEVGRLTAEQYEALGSHAMFVRELEKLEDERSRKSWMPR